MHFRTLLTQDLSSIDEIYQRYYCNDFTLPNLFHTIGSGVISSDSGLVGCGMVKLYPEAIIILDKSKPKIMQGKALKLLFENALRVCKEKDYNILNAHIVDDSYANLLVKHFKFEKMNQQLLQLELEA